MTSDIEFGVDLFADLLIRRVASRFFTGFERFSGTFVFSGERACMFQIHEGICISHIEFEVDLFAEILIRRVASRFWVLRDSVDKLSSVVRERPCHV